MKIMIGIGCDRNTPLATLEKTVELALTKIGAQEESVAGLASIDLKADERALQELSQKKGWKINFYPAKELAQVEVPNPSEVVMRYVGTPAVSEAAALLAGQVEMSALMVEKLKYKGDDGKNATVSIARMPDEDAE